MYNRRSTSRGLSNIVALHWPTEMILSVFKPKTWPEIFKQIFFTVNFKKMGIHKRSPTFNVPGRLVASYSSDCFLTKWKPGRLLEQLEYFVGNIPLKILQRTDLTIQADRSSTAMVKTVSKCHHITFTCSKLTIETQEIVVKYVQS